MKINLLYITHGSCDFMDDALFMGLVPHLQNVNVYFAMADYAGGAAGTIEQRADTIPFPWKNSWYSCAQEYNPIDYSIKYDVCIIGQAHVQNQEKFLELQHLLKPNAPVALVYCLDDGGPMVDVIVPYTHMFINNMVPDLPNTTFMPLACPYYIYHTPNTDEPEYAVNCQLGYTWPSRPPVAQAVLKAVNDLGVANISRVTMHSGDDVMFGCSPKTPLLDFPEVLLQSKIIVHERGTGFDAYRFWEGMATGNFVLCTPRNLFKANNMFIPDNVVFWNKDEELGVLIKCLLDVPFEKLMEIRHESRRQIAQYHLPHCRIETILRTLFS
jgi:hypothetical protein